MAVPHTEEFSVSPDRSASSTFEITDLSSSQMKADRSALIIPHGIKF